MLTKIKKSIVLLHGEIDKKAVDQLSLKDDVYVLEGRPLLASSRHLIGILQKRKIVPTVIADNMAGFLCARGMVKEIWLAYSDVEEEGVIGPIGSLILAILGKKHNIPVKCFPGKKIGKYLGLQKDLLEFRNRRIAPKGIKGYVPLVEEVPLKYIEKCYE